MKILMINPNTSQDFTQKIQEIADQYALPTTEVRAANPERGPRSIESIYDELLSAPGTLELAIKHLDVYDGLIIACYSDHPTIYALREITEKPVIGIAEASMYMACMLGHRFSVVTTNDAWEPLLWDAVAHYGLRERCASVRSTGMAVLELEHAGDQETRTRILAAARKAVQEDQAEVICLGCAGMTGLDKDLEKEIGVPVLDGVIAALKFMEGMIGYGLSTSKRQAYSHPYHKQLVSMSSMFEKVYQQQDH